MVRDSVRNKRAKFEHVTAHEVMNFLESQEILSFHRDISDSMTQNGVKTPIQDT